MQHVGREDAFNNDAWSKIGGSDKLNQKIQQLQANGQIQNGFPNPQFNNGGAGPGNGGGMGGNDYSKSGIRNENLRAEFSEFNFQGIKRFNQRQQVMNQFQQPNMNMNSFDLNFQNSDPFSQNQPQNLFQQQTSNNQNQTNGGGEDAFANFDFAQASNIQGNGGNLLDQNSGMPTNQNDPFASFGGNQVNQQQHQSNDQNQQDVWANFQPSQPQNTDSNLDNQFLSLGMEDNGENATLPEQPVKNSPGETVVETGETQGQSQSGGVQQSPAGGEEKKEEEVKDEFLSLQL